MSTLIKELINQGMVGADQVQAAREEQDLKKRPLLELLVAAGHFRGDDLFRVARKVFIGPSVDLERIGIDPQLMGIIPVDRAVYHGALPVRREGDTLMVAMGDPSDIGARDEIGFLSGLFIRPVLCRQEKIMEHIDSLHRSESSTEEILEDAIEDTDGGKAVASPVIDEAVDLSVLGGDDSAFVKLINRVLSDAVEARASDIHIEPRGKAVEVRYRIDGYLRTVLQVPRDLQSRLAVRIKLLARMDIAEQRKAQDGRIKVLLEGRKIDLRISVVPVFYGEKIVLRILDAENSQFDLKTLGFHPDELELFRDVIRKPQGAVLVTGPTGSGKTTTIYAALQHIKCETLNIITIEDPIEYLIEGINQLQLSRHKDVTFSTGLRSILRQDPDVILVGEIRDRETAEIALRASLTGHLVFSTLHTNGAVSSIARLADIGIEPYLIASSLSLCVAQRLVRLTCPHCCEEDKPEEKLLMKFRKYLESMPVRRFYKGKGCEQCNDSGFYGRTSIFEILKVDGQVKELICNKASAEAISKEARANGMRTLAEAGVRKVVEGLTTLQEVSRVVDVVGEDAGSSLFSDGQADLRLALEFNS